MKVTGKLNQDHILTAIVGSYPKPKYINPQSAKKLLDSFGFLFYDQERKYGKKEFAKLLDKAALQAIGDQGIAGIDIVTDGEVRRGHYVLDVLKKLNGADFNKRKRIAIREGIIERELPVVVDRITYAGKIVLDEFLFARNHTEKIVKVGLPGPSTVVDCVVDEFYDGDLEKMAYDYATAIKNEVAKLIEAGCQIIQFDDPVLLRYPDRAKKWGIQALEACFAGFEDKATFVVHICRGYPDKPLEKKGIIYKASNENYREILELLSTSLLDSVSIEGAQGNLDLSILPAIGKKTIMLGVLDVGENTVESVASLVERGKEALHYLPKEQLILAPDCGMVELTRTAAKNKLKNLALAAQKLNEM